MSVVQWRRPPRDAAPPSPAGEVRLEPPPERPSDERGVGPLQVFVLLALVVAVGTDLVSAPGALAYLSAGIAALAAIALVSQSLPAGSRTRLQSLAQRRDYLRYLTQLRQRVRQVSVAQRRELEWRHPPPELLWSLARGGRLWERRPADDDFGVLRLAQGPQRLATPLVAPETRPIEELDPITSMALRRFIRTHATVADLPTSLKLQSFYRICLRGEREAVLSLVRALLAQATVFHAPDELRIALVVARNRQPDWDWVKWLPHVAHRDSADAAGPRRLVAEDLAELETLLRDELDFRPPFQSAGPQLRDAPTLIVVCDGGRLNQDSQLMTGGLMGVTLLDLGGAPPAERSPGQLALALEGDDLSMLADDPPARIGRADQLDVNAADTLARRISRFRLAESHLGDSLVTPPSLGAMLGLDEPGWAGRAQGGTHGPLYAPLGARTDGSPLWLDLSAAEQGGDGPHGLLVGEAGSGKSDLLRLLVLGLAATHDPTEVTFLLVDAAAAADLTGLERLPHVAGSLTASANDPFGLRRLAEALNAELVRRRELLGAAGVATHRRYRDRFAAGGGDQPLPSLVVVIDEFPVLLTHPMLAETLRLVARNGRALGIHLLLAASRIEEESTATLRSYLSMRIALRTATAADSRAALGVADARELPQRPGNGYLLVGSSPPVRFRAAHSRARWPPAASLGRQPVVRPFALGHAAMDQQPATPPDESDSPAAQISDIIVGRLTVGQRVAPIWAPPATEPPALGALLPPLTEDNRRGLTPLAPSDGADLRVPLGVVEDARGNVRPVSVDLTRHLVIVGGPGSGKSTLLATAVCAAAIACPPTQLRIHCLDLGGGSLDALRRLPHVAGFAGGYDEQAIRAMLDELSDAMTRREQRDDGQGLTPRLLLAVDGWEAVREAPAWIEQRISEFAAAGPATGLQVVLASARWRHLRPALADRLANRVELRLSDPEESELDRRAAADVPPNAPGRGLVEPDQHFWAALPRLDGRASTVDLAQAVADLVERVRSAWRRTETARDQVLPTTLSARDLPAIDGAQTHRVQLGLSDAKAALELDIAHHPHLIVVGSRGSGKTNVLRLVASQLVARHRPDQLRLLVVDYRDTLAAAVPAEYLLGRASGTEDLIRVFPAVSHALRRRLPSDVDQVFAAAAERGGGRNRDPELYVVIDDYELVGAAAEEPVRRLVELLPHARDIGLHILLSRNSTGARAAMYQPLLQRMRESGAAGLVLSARHEDGPLFGTYRPSDQPPGRGALIHAAGDVRQVQVAWSDDGSG